MSPVRRSYSKTTLASLALAGAALASAYVAVRWLPNAVAYVVVALSALALVGAFVVACAGALVLARYGRSVRGARDLYLDLNRSREAATLAAAAPARVGGLRRWLARRLLGHDLVVGDFVEVRSWDEIRTTLDSRGCLEELPFMPEMLAMCGRRARVFRCMHRLFDFRKSRKMRHMDGGVLLLATVCDGSSHGGCDAACHTIWKAAWLRRVAASDEPAAAWIASGRSGPAQDVAVLEYGTRAPRYACQLTHLHAASQPIGRWSAANFLRPLISGNVAPAAFAVAWLTHLFNTVQHWRGGDTFPMFERPDAPAGMSATAPLRAGDPVVVRSSAEIRVTLTQQLTHRGLGFETDMLKHCGHRYCVQAEVRRLIDIVTGQMLTMKTPAYVLRDVHFSGERQLFNAQYEPLFWRADWLARDVD